MGAGGRVEGESLPGGEGPVVAPRHRRKGFEESIADGRGFLEEGMSALLTQTSLRALALQHALEFSDPAQSGGFFCLLEFFLQGQLQVARYCKGRWSWHEALI